jgi:hypothetical protein
MKHRLIVATCLTLLLALTGCGERKTGTGTYPPTDGDFVTNLDGRGTAKVWGIRFEVADPVGAASGSEFEGGLHSDPEQTNARVKITLGDDVDIQLQKVPGSPITFKLNGKPYGTLEVGDRVIIDKERNVKVNDTARQPEGAGS